ncbi:MAG: class I SAM-dependent methyltransferase [Anaerolineae bacterium]|nr:class I SAM-dependent methyltransferase [Anaerolineae bacterium]
MMKATPQQNSLLRLFQKSVLKQRKYDAIVSMLGPTDGLHCLDIGADNGVVSYLLRQRGGVWKSADLSEETVQVIRLMVGDEVYQIDGRSLPFESESLDRVVIVDLLEHVHTDREFIEDVYRVLKPGGVLVINVPHIKHSLLRKLRLAIGQTDALHGHVRPGYSMETLTTLLDGKFVIEKGHTYSKFFSEFIDTLIRQAVAFVKRNKQGASQKGHIVTDDDLHANQSMFKLYALIYPFVWVISQLDKLLFFRSGYVLIVRAKATK